MFHKANHFPPIANVGDVLEKHGRIFLCTATNGSGNDWTLVGDAPKQADSYLTYASRPEDMLDMLETIETREELRQADLEKKMNQLAAVFRPDWEYQRIEEEKRKAKIREVREMREAAIRRAREEREAARKAAAMEQQKIFNAAKPKVFKEPSVGPKGRRFDFD